MEKDNPGTTVKAYNNLINNTYLSKTDEVNALAKVKQEEITMKILESSKRSIRMIRDTEDIAVSTSRELHFQSEQLVKTKKSLEALNSSVKNNQQLMNQIKSPFGFLKNLVKRKQEILRSWKNKKPVESKLTSTSKSAPYGDNLEDSCSQRSKGDHKVSNNQRKYEKWSSSEVHPQKLLDDDLDEISCSVARLKNIALEMGNEIGMQNLSLDHVLNKTEKVSEVLLKQNNTIKKLMG